MSRKNATVFAVGLLSSVLLGGFFAAHADEAPAPRPAAAEAVPKAGPTAPPMIDGPKEVEYYGTFRVANLPKEAGVDWQFPDALKVEEVSCECDADGKVMPYSAAMRVAGPAGKYTVKARLIYVDPKTKRPRIMSLPSYTFTVKGTPGPEPDPQPDPKPDPKPDPEPKVGKVKAFVVVEDTSKAGQWRGTILGSPKVAAFYKDRGLTHRLLSVGLDGQDGALDAAGKEWIAKARGKDLPWMFVVNDQNKIVRSVKVNTDSDDAFIAQLTGEAEFARAMGNIPPPSGKTRGVFPKFGSAPNVPLIPREQWKTVNLSAFLPPVYDQDGIGACNAFATITAFEAARKQAGLPYVRVSPGFLYGAINGGMDGGSFLEDALEWMQTVGSVKGSTVGPLDWRKGRQLMNNAAARSEAKDYRIIEAYECPTFAHMASALQLGYFIDEGLMWFDNFTPDRDAWLPPRGAGQAGGHALAGYGLAYRNGAWGIMTRNSWSSQWGAGGNCVIPESLFDNRIGGFWAVRAVVQTNDANPIPVSQNDLPAATLARLNPIRGDTGLRHGLAW